MRPDMRNVAYSNEYSHETADMYRYLFSPDFYKGEDSEQLENGFGVFIKQFKSDSKDSKYPYYFSGCENHVFRNNLEIFSFKTVHRSAPCCKVFTHANGKEYFLYSKDLYGYSVLDLNTMLEFHFIPAESFNYNVTMKENSDFPDELHYPSETFIWCDIHYNPTNNIVAVGGCYWACPSDVILVDFSNPMNESPQIDINRFVGPENDYTDIEFVAWNGTDLILKIEEKTELTVSSEEYMIWFSKN